MIDSHRVRKPGACGIRIRRRRAAWGTPVRAIVDREPGPQVKQSLLGYCREMRLWGRSLRPLSSFWDKTKCVFSSAVYYAKLYIMNKL